MISIPTVGGVKVMGTYAQDWQVPERRMINYVSVAFDKNMKEPMFDVLQNKFVLPAFHGQHDYVIHLLENSDAVIMKNGKFFLCTRRSGNPIVVTFIDVSVSQPATQAVA